jgi:hypothetical protein
VTPVPTATPVPTTPPDNDPPPVPSPTVPADDLVIDCPTDPEKKQTLAWLPVTDPSGVTYYVKLESQVTATEWQVEGGYGPLTDKQVEVDVECGIIYRWAVRAQDGAGNWSDWSEWFQFSIDMM